MLVTFAIVALVLVGAELGFRSVVPRLSANSRSIAASADRAASLAASQDTTVLVLGNSISGEGIDASVLNDALSQAGVAASVWHQPADTTAMRDWSFELQNLFIARGAVPDVVVLPVGFERPLVRVNERTEDLYQSFLGPGDLRVLFELDGVTDIEERAGARLSHLSALYGFRGRVQKRIQVALIPRYEQMWEGIRSAAAAGDDAPLVINAAWAERFDALADEHGIDVVVVAMPTVVLNGRLPDEDRALAAELGWRVLEPAADVPFSDAERPDGFHLTHDARARFSALLAPALVDLLTPEATP